MVRKDQRKRIPGKPLYVWSGLVEYDEIRPELQADSPQLSRIAKMITTLEIQNMNTQKWCFGQGIYIYI